MTSVAFKHSCLLLVLALLSSPLRADVFVSENINTDPSPQNFNVCYNNTCANIATLSLRPEQWRHITDAFTPPARDAADEREKIREAIARMEIIVGWLTGTHNDKRKNDGYYSDGNQMDCIDESTNTTIYLMMLSKVGLIHFHTIEDRETRGYFIFGWPHTTAVIRDKQTGQKYAVDSWFLDNGNLPFVLPLQVWADGWDPEKNKQ